MKSKLNILVKKIAFFGSVPAYLRSYFSVKSAKRVGKMTILVEFQTTNEFFYLKPVLEKLHQENTFIVFFIRPKLYPAIKELNNQFFPENTPKILDIFWIHKFPFVDFYINATQSYDIQIPKKSKYKINFPHTITSKAKNDVFSPAIEKMSHSFNSGEVYTKDLEIYFKDQRIKNPPEMCPVGSPKSDSLFDHTINQKEFLSSIGLDPNKKTIMYAPTWNQEASLPTWLEHILDIPEKFGVNLIIKIHPGMYIDPKNKKSSGGVDWKKFLDNESLKNKGIVNAFHTDSPDYIMASDITITDISTLWIEYYFLRRPMIFLDIPEFFKKLGMNSMGDFRDKYGYVVQEKTQLDELIDKMLKSEIKGKEVFDIDNLLLFNKGRGTEKAVEKIKELYARQK